MLKRKEEKTPYTLLPHLPPPQPPSSERKVLPAKNVHTLNDDVLPPFPLPPLGRRFRLRVLLPELGQHERADGLDDAGEDGVARVEEPAVRVGRVVEVDAAFEDGVLRYAEVAADGWHIFIFFLFLSLFFFFFFFWSGFGVEWMGCGHIWRLDMLRPLVRIAEEVVFTR